MKKLYACCEQWAPYALSIMRIVVAMLFMCHGTQKLFGFPTAEMERPALLSWLGAGGLIESTGGLLVVVGLFTRPAAFVLCGEMAVAYFKFHFSRAFWPIHNHGELAVVYCFVFLYLCAAGGGPISLDYLFFTRREPGPDTFREAGPQK